MEGWKFGGRKELGRIQNSLVEKVDFEHGLRSRPWVKGDGGKGVLSRRIRDNLSGRAMCSIQ